MPAIILHTSAHCGDDQKADLAKRLSSICASEIGKPESYVISVVEDGAAISFGGEAKEAAFVEVKSIGGLSRETNGAISSAVCDLLNETLGIDPLCVYLNFTNVGATEWGWNGKTFG